LLKTFQQGVAIIKPQGFLDGDNARNIITPADMNGYKQRKIFKLEVNLSQVVSINLNAIRFLNDIFRSLYSDNIESFIVAPNSLVLSIITRVDDRYFSILETEEIASLFCKDTKLEKTVYIYSESIENKNFLLYELIKRGYEPIVLNSKSEFLNKKSSQTEAIFIEKSLLSKMSHKVVSFTKENVVFFYLDGFLDAHLSEQFDIEYFRRSLLIGFRVFVFDAANVKGINIHAVRYLSKLAVESAEYGALLCVVGLQKKDINPNILNDMEDTGYMFFANMEEFHSSQEVKDTLQELTQALKQKRKTVTKPMVEVLPHFVNSTIETIELLTGVTSKKDTPNLKPLEKNIKNKSYLASSIGFYGDLDGMLVLVFSENLTKKVSKILLGESELSIEALNDMVSEFANIIVGNVKSNVSKHSIKIDLTLPKVFDKMDNLFKLVEEKKGIEVKFDFEGEEFYFFLTR
jgi:CheY-specific phosphatase CheX/anti-anti-sigma regulatory factor